MSQSPAPRPDPVDPAAPTGDEGGSHSLSEPPGPPANLATDRLGTQSIPRLLWQFCVPAVVGMFVQAIYNIVDRIYLGQGVDELAIAGVGLVMPVMMIIQALSILIGVGANSLFAIRMGQGRTDVVEKIMGHAFVLLFVIPGIGIIAANIFFETIVRDLLGASDDVYPYAATYLRIILYGSIFAAMSPGLTHFIRSDGHPRTSMLVQIIGALCNIVLDPIFIFGFDMGVAGAAWATIISQFVSLVFVLGYFNSRFTRLRFRLRNMRLEPRLVGSIMAIGAAPCVLQLAMSLVGVFQNQQLIKYGGDMALTAMTITFSVGVIIFMPLMGIGQGTQPIIGYNYGAQKYDRVKRTFMLSLAGMTAVLVLGWLASELTPGLLVRVFSDDTGELAALAATTLRIANCLFPLVGLSILGGQFFQSIGKPVQAAIVSLSRQVLLFLPCLYLFPLLWPQLGRPAVEGIFWSFPAADLLAALLTFVFVSREFKRLGTGVNDNRLVA
ncbi:MAG: MATE family efflux transporter [Propionibacteriaceae bacterium]|jgi:putative MATE family efflux protein|nr:MATE family efflux transporter [Propionibacteriaceae bacterium]